MSETLRTELIETAVKFLTDPQVTKSSLSRRLAFLESKGLTAAEIEVAVKRAESKPSAEVPALPSGEPQRAMAGPEGVNKQLSAVKTVALLAVLLGGSAGVLFNYTKIKVH